MTDPSRPLRMAVVSDGDPAHPHTNSGVAKGILDALSADPRVEVVARIDSTPRGPGRLINLVLGFRRERHHWKNVVRKGWLSTRLRSRRRDRALQKCTRPDLVLHVRNTYLPAALPYVAFLDGTSSISQRGWTEWQMPPRDYRVRLRQETKYFRRAVAVFTAGEHVAMELKETYGVEESKAIPIGGGLNFDPATVDVPDRGGDVAGPLRLLFVGTEFDRKGGPLLLRAFARARASRPDLELLIVGPPPPPAVSDGVVWKGRIESRTELAEAYRSAHVFCLPSVFEPYGLAVQEAMAFGLPSIVTDVGALPSMIGGGLGGVVVPPGDLDRLCDAILLLAEDAAARLAKGVAARQLLADRTWVAVADRLVDRTLHLLPSA